MSLDWQGHYRKLGLTPGASDAEIKAAFRSKARQWHPDRNPGRDTTAEFQAVNAAYEILRDSERRQAYDSEGLRQQQIRQPPHPDGHHDAVGPGHIVAVHVCSACHCLSAQLRVVSFYHVYGLIIYTGRHRHTAILCPRCALETGFRANLRNWVLGWWGFPMGPLRVVEASLVNSRGGELRRHETVTMLLQQAQAFHQAGKPKLVNGLLTTAINLAPDAITARQIIRLRQELIGNVAAARLKNQWRFWGQPVYMIQLLVHMIAGLWIILFLGSHMNWFGLGSMIHHLDFVTAIKRILP